MSGPIVEELSLSGLLLVTPQVFRDGRGFFMESWRETLWSERGIGPTFVQDNHSASVGGTLRGLHYQTTPGQGKLVRCTAGKIWDVAVDLRPDSPTHGQWCGVELNAETHRQLWIPVGFAHGFCVLSESAEVQYKCTAVYNPATEAGIAWDDSDLAIAWPISSPLLSERDTRNPPFRKALPIAPFRE